MQRGMDLLVKMAARAESAGIQQNQRSREQSNRAEGNHPEQKPAQTGHRTTSVGSAGTTLVGVAGPMLILSIYSHVIDLHACARERYLQFG